MQTNDYKTIIDNADRLRSTINTPGWKDIVKIKDDKKEYWIEKACTEKELAKILYAQACVEAFDMIFSEIDACIKQGDEARGLNK